MKRKITLQDKFVLAVGAAGDKGITKREVLSSLGKKETSHGTTWSWLAKNKILWNSKGLWYKGYCWSSYVSEIKHLLISEKLELI
jgi:hypothetical protein